MISAYDDAVGHWEFWR